MNLRYFPSVFFLVVLVLAAAGLMCLPGSSGAAADETESIFRREVVVLPDGSLGVRYVLDAPEPSRPFWQPPVEMSPEAAGGGPASQAPSRLVGDTLWTDRYSQGAVPEKVAISGNGMDIVAGWWLNNQRFSHYLRTIPKVPTLSLPLDTSFPIPVDASYTGQVLATTGSYDSLYAFSTVNDTLYHLSYPPQYHGGLAVTCDSATVVVTTAIRGDTTLVQGRDAVSGDSLWAWKTTEWVNGLDLSSNGAILAVTTASGIQLRYGLTGVARDTLSLPGGSPWPAAVSGDGSLVVVGGNTPMVRLYEWDGVSSYTLRWQHNTSATYVTAVDVSDDGSTVLAGTFINTSPTAGSLLSFDAASPTPLWVLTQFGDLVSSVSLSAHGEYGVAGCWGRKGGTMGYVLVIFKREFWFPLVYAIADDQIFGVGSMLSVEMADHGGYCAASARAGHARVVGNGGAVVVLSAPEEVTTVPGEISPSGASSYALFPNRPNPSNPSTVIPFRAPERGGLVDLDLFDVGGRRVRQLVSSARFAGPREVSWDGRDDTGRSLPSGIYFYRLRGEGFAETRKLLLVR